MPEIPKKDYVRSPEDEALMQRVSQESVLENQERDRKIGMKEELRKQKTVLEQQISVINKKLAGLGEEFE